MSLKCNNRPVPKLCLTNIAYLIHKRDGLFLYQVYEHLKIKKKLIFSRYEAGKGAERKVPMFEDLPDPSEEKPV